MKRKETKRFKMAITNRKGKGNIHASLMEGSGLGLVLGNHLVLRVRKVLGCRADTVPISERESGCL